MDEPKHILQDGTKVTTHNVLGPTTGMLIVKDKLDNRRPGAFGEIVGVVAGHGGDVYWVRHFSDGSVAAYGWPEMELWDREDKPPPAPEPKPKVVVYMHTVDTHWVVRTFTKFDDAFNAFLKDLSRDQNITDTEQKAWRQRFEEERVISAYYGSNFLIEAEIE